MRGDTDEVIYIAKIKCVEWVNHFLLPVTVLPPPALRDGRASVGATVCPSESATLCRDAAPVVPLARRDDALPPAVVEVSGTWVFGCR